MIAAISFCVVASAQHPGSRGGNPLYWGIVGAIGAGIIYLLYLVVGYIIAIIKRLIKYKSNNSISKNNVDVKKKSSHKDESSNYIKVKETFDSDNAKVDMDIHFKDVEKLEHSQSKICKYCSKLIPEDAIYCSYCGKRQDKVPSSLNKIAIWFSNVSIKEQMKELIRFILSLAICAAIGGIFALICDQLGYRSRDEVAICIIAPMAVFLFYLLIAFAYNFNYKRKKVTAILLSIIIIIIWSLCIYSSVESRENEEQYKKEQLLEEQRKQEEERKYIINRSFLHCSLGDTKVKVEQELKASGIQYNSNSDTITVRNIDYGSYTMKTIEFEFYNSKVYEVIMDIQPIEHDNYDDHWTYNHIVDILGNKYGEDCYNPYDGKKYNNMMFYCDMHTLISLWRATYSMGEYRVTLTYYDRDSGYKEHQEIGF